MTLADLIRRFRALTKDEVEPYLWSDQNVTDWLNDAQVLAAVRGRLLLEDMDPALCAITVAAGTANYQLHPKLYELVRVAFKANGSRSSRLKIVTREWMDSRFSNWRDWDVWQTIDSCQRYAIQDEGRLRIAPMPSEDGQLLIEGYRTPLAAMADPDDVPEIHEASHVYLIQHALACAFRVPDSEVFDADRSRDADRAFTEHFGPSVDADMRRSTREDTPQVVAVHLI